jgi:protoheme IX farnesyltransferase
LLIIARYFSVTKPKIIILLLITALSGLFLAAQGLPDPLISMAVMVGGAFASGGANAINNFYDRDIDIKMNRTRSKRHVATGKVSPIGALILGVSLNIAAFVVLWQWANLLSALLALSATLFYVFIYTIALKRFTSQNIVIGGAAGAIPPVIGYAAINGNALELAPISLFLLIFLWTPPHFWALSLILKDDYQSAGIPMMPVVHGIKSTKKQIFVYTIVLLIFVVLSSIFVSDFGYLYRISSILLTLGFIVFAWKLMRSEDIKMALPTYLFSLAYLAVIFICVIIDSILRIY